MKRLFSVLLVGLSLGVSAKAASDLATAPADPAEVEALYTAAIERRAADILDSLHLKEPAKANEVKNVIMNHYRALRARDAVIDAYLRAKGEDVENGGVERNRLYKQLTNPLHELYVRTLAGYLSPEQVEIVKDLMTYNKVQVTFDAYCEIIPKLSDSEKALITKLLKDAREEAIDGGSATEKHAIFDRYKEKINAQLKSNGHDVDKLFQEWEAKQALASGAGAKPATSN
jgi:hypothetical protein